MALFTITLSTLISDDYSNRPLINIQDGWCSIYFCVLALKVVDAVLKTLLLQTRSNRSVICKKKFCCCAITQSYFVLNKLKSIWYTGFVFQTSKAKFKRTSQTALCEKSFELTFWKINRETCINCDVWWKKCMPQKYNANVLILILWLTNHLSEAQIEIFLPQRLW